MKIKRFITIVVFIFFPVISSGVEHQWGVGIDEYLCVKNNFGLRVPPTADLILSSPTGNNLKYTLFDRDTTYNLLSITPEWHISFNENLHSSFSGDLNWFRTLEADEEHDDDADFFVENAWIGYTSRAIGFSFGVQSFDIGNRFIFYDNEPGAMLKYQAADHYLSLTAAGVMNDSPLISGTVGYVPGFFEKVEAFGAYFKDEDNHLTRLLNQFVLTEEDYLSYGLSQGIASLLSIDGNQADFFWGGFVSELFINRMFFRATGILQSGSVTLYRGTEPNKYNVSGFLADAGLSYNVSDWLTIEGFFFTASGDDKPFQGHLTTFFSPGAYNKRGRLFFNPEFFDIDNSHAIGLGGMLWPGVLAPGCSVAVNFQNGVTGEIGIISCYTEETFGGSHKHYGDEIDLRFDYRLKKQGAVFVEICAFSHGDYFKEVYQAGNPDGLPLDTASSLILGFNLFF